MLLRKILMMVVSVALTMIMVEGTCFADKIIKPVEKWQETEFQGKISYLSPGGDFVIASERKVFLVDMSYGGKRYITTIADSYGSKIKFSDLRVGRWIYVWGGLLEDNTVGARAIFTLPGQLDEVRLKKRYDPLKKYQPWGQ